MNEKKVGIIILNYITYDETLKLLEYLKNIDYRNFFAIVVDDNSPNESNKILSGVINKKSYFSYEIYFIETNYNGGYSYGNNIGIKKADELNAEYVLIMNNDIYPLENKFLRLMVDFLEQNKNAAMVGPQIIEKDNKIKVNYLKRPLGKDYIIKYLFHPFYSLSKKIFCKKQEFIIDVNQLIKVYSVAGSIYLIDIEKIKDVGLLDENVFLFGEELILGEKLFKKNLGIYYLPYVKVIHNHSLTVDILYNSLDKLKIRLKSNLYYITNYRKDISIFSKILIKMSFYFEISVYQPVIKFLKKIKNSNKSILF